MKTNLITVSLIIILFTITANSQITKGNWMVGGDGSYVNTTISQNGYTSKYSITEINPDIGYFIKDKLAIGSSLKFENYLYKDTSVSNSSYFLGVFTRYYFLNQKNIYNIFSQINYDYNIHTSGLTSIGNKFGVKIGAVAFFTNSVGLELSLGYDTNTTKVKNRNSSSNTKRDNLKASIGFHFYLEKN